MKQISTFFSILFLFTAAVAAQEYTSRDQIDKDLPLKRDFEIQGEYLYKPHKSSDGNDGESLGLNLIAEGKGRFKAVAFNGGLPGDGWKRGDERMFGSASVNPNGDLQFEITEEDKEGKRVKIEEKKILKGVAKITGKKLTASIGIGGLDIPFEKVERKSPTLGLKAPEGAIVVFADGKKSDILLKGEVNTEAKTLWSEAVTKPFERKPYTLHLEFCNSYMPNARGQGRSNSGCYIDECYECQILDSFGLEGENNECGGFYQLAKPAVNMCFPPLQWQTYDIDYTQAKFDENGKKTANAVISVKHNGVQIHENFGLPRNTAGNPKKEELEAHGVYFQGHGNKVQYRNVWVQYK